jgi:hypothetical protein
MALDYLSVDENTIDEMTVYYLHVDKIIADGLSV